MAVPPGFGLQIKMEPEDDMHSDMAESSEDPSSPAPESVCEVVVKVESENYMPPSQIVVKKEVEIEVPDYKAMFNKLLTEVELLRKENSLLKRELQSRQQNGDEIVSKNNVKKNIQENCDVKSETIDEKKIRNREYQRAWRQRQNALKVKISKEEKEAKRKERHRRNQRAYYRRQKLLEMESKNAEAQENGDLQMKRMKMENNEDQNVVLNIETVKIERNPLFRQECSNFEESCQCITPEIKLHRITDITMDENCLFHSLIRLLQLKISATDLRKQLLESPYLNYCQNYKETYKILSNDKYCDLDSVYLFSRIYKQNICVHNQYFNPILQKDVTRYCLFKENDTNQWIHLNFRDKYFTPYFNDDEKIKDDDRKQKEKNKQYSKRYRDRKRTSTLQIGKHVLDLKPVMCNTKIDDLSIDDPNISSNSIKISRKNSSEVVQLQQNNINKTYTALLENSPAHKQFEKDFLENDFGHTCNICDRLWFRKDLKCLLNIDSTRNIDFIRNLLTNDLMEIKLCSTCLIAVQKRCVPPLSVYNGFKYPEIPKNLKSNPLDLVQERFVSPRILFTQIRRLFRCENQIYGQSINLPMEINTMVKKLPRSDDHAYTVNIKGRKVHKSKEIFDIVSKRKIKMWLQYLKGTPLYKFYKVKIDDDFLKGFNVKEEIIDENDDILEEMPKEESLIAQQQTLMWNDDLYFKIAAGEGNAPKSFLFEDHAEEMSFPQIYLGQFRAFKNAVTPFMMATSEIRRSDRRGVKPQHLLYMAMRIIRIRIKGSLKIAFKQQGAEITKEQIQSDDYIQDCVETNLAFLRSVPNSLHYWAERKRDLFAMIRQFGKPTVFFTISANEIYWPDLLKLLYNLKNDTQISVEEAEHLHFIEKSTLVNEDAVTCAIYFRKLVEILLKVLQSKRHSPFKKYRVVNYFQRIEFQHRGSPNAHILAWLDNAPEDLNKDYDKAIDLIDFLVSVSAKEASGEIKLQTHNHNFNCNNNRLKRCKFDAPFMPVKKTMILTPLPDTDEDFKQYKAKYDVIKDNLEKNEYNDFDSFYSQNYIESDDEYIKIIRSGIDRTKVFPKREPSEKWNNPFNPFILNVVRSETDFQFITDEDSCAAYVVDYINKTDRGVSDLQKQIVETMKKHPDFNLFDVAKDVSDNILKKTEMTTQEAAFYLLREPMSCSSTDIVYIPTIWPVERHRVKKTIKEISDINNSMEGKDNWFDKYENRPKYLENISLAQFVGKYHKKLNVGYILGESRVIRYRNYDMTKDYNEYRREMVTLHIPFRNEESEILAESRYIQLYDENEALILDRRKEFESNFDVDKLLEICRELCRKYFIDDGEEINVK